MAELPTIKEMAEKVAKEALEIICAEKSELKEINEAYEDGFNAGKAEAEREFQNSDYWNDYLAKVIADAKADGYNQALEDCCNVLRQCWLNGTVANRIIEEQIAEIEKLKR